MIRFFLLCLMGWVLTACSENDQLLGSKKRRCGLCGDAEWVCRAGVEGGGQKQLGAATAFPRPIWHE